jgi:hypothetical protein
MSNFFAEICFLRYIPYIYPIYEKGSKLRGSSRFGNWRAQKDENIIFKKNHICFVRSFSLKPKEEKKKKKKVGSCMSINIYMVSNLFENMIPYISTTIYFCS